MMLTKKMQEDQARYRKELALAMRSLPSREVLDIVAANLVSRNDYSPKEVTKFLKEVNEWAWSYVEVPFR